MFSLRNERTLTRVLLGVVIVSYLALCGASFAYHDDKNLLEAISSGSFGNDDSKYLRSAWTLLETGRYTYRDPGQDTVFIMPGLTTVLAAFVAVFGRLPILPFKIFQALLGGLCLFLIFLIGRRLFGAKAGLTAAALMAVYGPNIYATSLFLTEMCFYALLLLTVLCTIHAVEERAMGRYVEGGIFLGLATLFRPTILLFPLVVLGLWLIKKYPLGQMLRFAGAVIGVVCLILSPWITRNAILFGEFIPLTRSSGNPMLQGTFIDYDQSVRETENIDYYGIIKETTDIDIDRYGQNNDWIDNQIEMAMVKIRFEKVISREPLKYLAWYTVGKTLWNWKDPFVWTLLFGLPGKWQTIQHAALLALGAGGMVLMLLRRKKMGVQWILLLFPAFFNLVHLPFFCFSRYMFPAMFCVAVLGGYFLESICSASGWERIFARFSPRS